jgi:hypothetical protein
MKIKAQKEERIVEMSSIDGKTEKSIDAQEKVRSLSINPIKKLTVLISLM